MPLSAGTSFAGYTVVRLLGSGGMGEVYLVQHPRLPRREALKILPPSLTADAAFRQRFLREADLAAKLFHPHIVEVHDRGEFDNQLWISMDYIDGTDAARLVRDHYPAGMPLDEAVTITTAVASALDHAHERGLLHRDVKPANILLTDPDASGQRRIFLADFGIARPLAEPSSLTATNLTVGTVAYAAPEQLMGEEIDGRADEYALAATVFHLLTGAPPYHQSNPVAVISQHLNAPPPRLSSLRPDLARLDDVFFTALAKNPADRFGQCHELATTLSERAGSSDRLGVDRTESAMARTRPRWRDRAVFRAAALAFVLAVAAVVGYIVANRGPSSPPAPTGAPSPSPPAAPPAAPPPSVVPTSTPTVTAAPSPSVVPTSTPTVTVTATPARPTRTQASGPELDQQYLNEVTGLWGGRPAKPDAVIRNGHRACELLAQNPDPAAATRRLLAEQTAAGAAGGFDPETEYARTNAVVVAASDVYCPQ